MVTEIQVLLHNQCLNLLLIFVLLSYFCNYFNLEHEQNAEYGKKYKTTKISSHDHNVCAQPCGMLTFTCHLAYMETNVSRINSQPYETHHCN
jgi:hypothetical protein